MIAALAFVLMQRFALDPREAHIAAYGVVVGALGLLWFAAYLVANEG